MVRDQAPPCPKCLRTPFAPVVADGLDPLRHDGHAVAERTAQVLRATTTAASAAATTTIMAAASALSSAQKHERAQLNAR